MSAPDEDPIKALAALGDARRTSFKQLQDDVERTGRSYRAKRSPPTRLRAIKSNPEPLRELFARGATMASLARACGVEPLALRQNIAPLPPKAVERRTEFTFPDPELTAAVDRARTAHPTLPLAQLATESGMPYAVLARARSQDTPATFSKPARKLARFVATSRDLYDSRQAARSLAIDELSRAVERQQQREHDGTRTTTDRAEPEVIAAAQHAWKLGSSILQDITPALAPLGISHQPVTAWVRGVKSPIPEKRRGRYDRPLHITDPKAAAAIYDAAAAGLNDPEISEITGLTKSTVQRFLKAETERRGNPPRPPRSQRAPQPR